MTQHSSAVDAINEVERTLGAARANDQFMVAVWWFENGKRCCAKTTWQFPRPQMDSALNQLSELLQAENENQDATPPPLPLARIFDSALDTSPAPVATAVETEEQSSEERPND